MGKGGIYGKRKKQERPASPRARYASERGAGENTGTKTASGNYEVDRYKRKGSKQKGLDTSLKTTQQRKWERDRRKGGKKKGK